MNDDTTRNLSPDDKLNLILSETGSIKSEVRSLNERIAALEAKSYDTRPIQERALAEILEMKERQGRMEIGLTELNDRQGRMETELQEVRKELRQIRRQFEQVAVDQVKIRADLRDLDLRMAGLEDNPERPPA